MAHPEELTIGEGRFATLTCEQAWTTHAAGRRIVGDLLVVVDNTTGSEIDAVIYDDDGKRKVGILRQRVVWVVSKNPAVDSTSSIAFEIPDARPDQEKEILGVYERFRKQMDQPCHSR